MAKNIEEEMPAFGNLYCRRTKIIPVYGFQKIFNLSLISLLNIRVSSVAMHHLKQASSRSLRRAAVQATKPLLARGAHKEIKFSNEGRAAILKGVEVLAKAVSVTLGPKGGQLLLN